MDIYLVDYRKLGSDLSLCASRTREPLHRPILLFPFYYSFRSTTLPVLLLYQLLVLIQAGTSRALTGAPGPT